MELIAWWGKHPPLGELAFSSLKALGFEWKSMEPTTKKQALVVDQGQQTKLTPDEMAAMGIKTFDQLPASIQQMIYDAKHNPEKLGLRKPN